MDVVQAFLTVPDVLLLDEPVSGQDVASQREFIDMVNTLNREHGVYCLVAIVVGYWLYVRKTYGPLIAKESR